MSKTWIFLKRWLPATVISLGLLILLLSVIDIGKVWLALKRANLLLVSLAVAGSIIWLLIRAQVWRSLIKRKPNFEDTFFSLSEGYLMNNFLPFRMGEVGKTFLLSRKSGLGFMEIAPTVIIERVVDLIFSAGMMVISLPLILGYRGTGNISILVGGIMLVGLLMLYFMARNRNQVKQVFDRIHFRNRNLEISLGKMLNSFLDGLSVLVLPKVFITFLIWMTLDWLIAIIQYTLLLRAFFPQAGLTWGVFSLGAAAFGGAIPSLPGAIGTLDAAVGGAVVILSQNVDTAAAYVLVMRLINYLVTGIPAVIALNSEGQTLKSLFNEVKGFRNRINQKEEGV